MKRGLGVVYTLSFLSPIALTSLAIYWLGWPFRTPYPEVYFVLYVWGALTFVCSMLYWKGELAAAARKSSAFGMAGCLSSLPLLMITLSMPDITSGFCNTARYDFHNAAINERMNAFARRLDDAGCCAPPQAHRR